MTATHKIVDGDTLSSLAVRYLGDERRYMEIYQQNRDVLSSPHTLPIGRTLRMPPLDANTASRGDSPRNPGDLAPELHPLVPRS
jgi:nucleoid-associated protein YgaU